MATSRVLTSGHFVLGPEVESFKANFAAFCETRHAFAVSTGTSTLHLALLAAGIGPRDQVITTTSTFVVTVAAILYTGDIDQERLILDLPGYLRW